MSRRDGRTPEHAVLDDVLAETRVSLRFVLGRRPLQTAEAVSLGIGQILVLEGAMPPRVEIIVDDVVIGSGELVSVDGRRGVRITELFEQS